MKSIQTIALILLLFAIASTSMCLENTDPKVVVSITPFYGLVASVMEGVGTPHLLVKPGASPHQYALKSSDIQALKEADILFWAGPTLETFLVKPLQTITENRPSLTIIEFEKTPKLLLLPLRQGPTWAPHHHDNHAHSTIHSIEMGIDMHFWLDPKNALILTDSIIKNLARLDPAHANRYRQNGKKLEIRLKKLDLNIATQLNAVKTIPYIVFHDAYQYFEHRYELNGVGAITLHPEMPPSAKRLNAIREMIQKTKVHCVFTEPQFHPALVQSIVQDLAVNQGDLDPEGQEAQKNINGYFELLENLSTAFKNCLSSHLTLKQ